MNHDSRPRIGLLTSTDPYDRRSWSGVHYSILRAAERNMGPVTALGPMPMVWPMRIGDNISRRLIKPLTGLRHQYSWSIPLAYLYGQKFGRRIREEKLDLLLAPASFTEIAYLDTDVPIVYIEDSTLGQLIDFYPGVSGLHPLSKRELNYIEKRALTKASLVAYSSEWAARSAIEDYGTPADKVVVIPFGANYPEQVTPSYQRSDVCRLFLLGGEWGRKGVETAYDAMVKLNDWGIPATLTVVGCLPPAAEAHRFQHPNFTAIPYLNMGKEADLKQLTGLFSSADFFILPSRAECAAIAFADANAFGLPVITTNVGGISSFVEQGESGVMLPVEATGQDFAATIKELYSAPATYARMRSAARQRYEAVLNWDRWAQQLKHELAVRGLWRTTPNAVH